jgi:hypothetical protein
VPIKRLPLSEPDRVSVLVEEAMAPQAGLVRTPVITSTPPTTSISPITTTNTSGAGSP